MMRLEFRKRQRGRTGPSSLSRATVRGGGFSAVFVNVGKDVQDEVITRRRHVA